MGMVPHAPAKRFELAGRGDGKHIIILGAGLAGMTSAWEMQQLGYKVTILEARERTGGRVWTVRGGDNETEIDGVKQTCQFDSGQYLNAGAARIPHHHELTLHYCKQLGVKLEVYNNINESGYFYSQSDNGKLANSRIRIRELHNDMRGYVGELLHKAVDTDSLDLPFTKEDKEKFLEYLSIEGDLDTSKLYTSTSRRGYKSYPGAGERKGEESDAYELLDLIRSGYLDPSFSNLPDYDLNLQQTLFQPVGGMDRISQALEQQVSESLIKEAEVVRITNKENQVSIAYNKEGKEQEIQGDYCICTLPLPVLSGVNSNFSANVLRAIDFVPYNKTGKIGLQFKRRFWEEDDAIYGGISRTNMDLTQIFYPNCDYMSAKGVLVGYYNFGKRAVKLANMSLQDREKTALDQGRLIHPQYDEAFENSFSLAWHKTKYTEGGWAQYNQASRSRFYPELIKPDGRVYFAGEHTTYLTAWMAGAFESARRTVDMIHARVNETESQYDTKK
ncbi:MAG: flavin monoamine oxidase family protein [Cyclobacteriaceae bacterium]